MIEFFFKVGTQGILIEEDTLSEGATTAQSKVFVRGVSEQLVHGNWAMNYIVPSDCIKKGAPWRDDIMDWDFRVNLVENTVDISHLTVPTSNA
jgi:hypothetical protein